MIVVAGENVVDLFPSDEPGTYLASPGGSPANTAIALARLGCPVELLARVSTDTFGRQVMSRLGEADIGTELVVRTDDPSTLAAVSFDATGNPSYDFWLQGTADWGLLPEQLPTTLAADALHLGSIAAFRPPVADTLLGLLQRQGHREPPQGSRPGSPGVSWAPTLSFDPNIRAKAIGGIEVARARLRQLLPVLHLVKVSDEDLDSLAPGEDPMTIARQWLRQGPSLVVLTRGGSGAVAITDSIEVEVNPPQITVADTVGAGDALSGALLSALWRLGALGSGAQGLLQLTETQLADVLRQAVTAAAINCTRTGAQPPTDIELRQALGTKG